MYLTRSPRDWRHILGMARWHALQDARRRGVAISKGESREIMLNYLHLIS